MPAPCKAQQPVSVALTASTPGSPAAWGWACSAGMTPWLAVQGVDLVWETVGGDMLQACLRNLAVKGRLVVIGMMSQYASGWKPSSLRGVPELLLAKSATMTGFFYPHHFRHLKAHLRRLMEAWSSGRLHVSVDPTRFVCAAARLCPGG